MRPEAYNDLVFVTFEGPDGAGKSTVLHAVAEALREDGRSVYTTRQPGDSSLNVRQLILEAHAIEPLAELFLFLADRAQHVAESIRPALEQGQVVLCDRYGDSTVAYQGFGRGLDVELLRNLNHTATGGLVPDLTLLIDIEPEEGLRRVAKPDRLDRESPDFHRRVREGFLEEAAREPNRWKVVSGDQPVERVVSRCLEAIRERLSKQFAGT